MMQRTVLVLAVGVAVGCAGVRRVGPPPRPNFESVHGWNMLYLGIHIEDARRLLEDAGLPFEEQRRTVDGTTRLVLQRPGWDAGAEFDASGRLRQIRFESTPTRDFAPMKQALRSYNQRFGPAHLVYERNAPEEKRQDTLYSWYNGSTRLTVTLRYYWGDGDWVLDENYAPSWRAASR